MAEQSINQGFLEVQALRRNGADDRAVQEYVLEQADVMRKNGAADEDLNSYFAKPKVGMDAFNEYVNTNLQKINAQRLTTELTERSFSGENLPGPVPYSLEVIDRAGLGKDKPQVADSFMDWIEAGLDVSVGRLLMAKPDMVLPPNAGAFAEVVAGISTVAGDIASLATPAGMVAGGKAGAVLGGLVGTTLPLVGTLSLAGVGAGIGAAYGAWALPEAMRKILLDHYEKGEFENFNEFWQRAVETFAVANKAGITGVATGGFGKVGGMLMKPLGKAAQTTGTLAAELGSLVSVGAILEGRAPTRSEFIHGAGVIFGLKGLHMGASKLRNIYHRTGLFPWQVAEHAKKDPFVLQDLLSENHEVPRSYKGMEQALEKLGGKESTKISIPQKLLAPLKGIGEKLPDAMFKKLAQQEGTILINTPKLKPSKKAEPPLSKEEQSVADIMHTEKTTTLSGDILTTARKTFNEFYTIAVDDLHPLNQFAKWATDGKVSLAISKNPYLLARLHRGLYGKVEHAIKYKTFDFKNLEINGKGLVEILKPARGKLESLDRYLVARTALERHRLTKKLPHPKFDPVKAQEFINQNPQFKKIAEEVTAFENRVLEYLVDAEVIGRSDAVKIQALNKEHAPLNRVMDPAIDREQSPKTAKNLIKAAKGSERDILSPIEQIIRNAATYIKAAEHNRIMVATADLALRPGGEQFGKKVKLTSKPIKVAKSEIQKLLKESGITDPDMISKMSDLAFTKNPAIFRPMHSRLGKNQTYVFRKGKAEVWEWDPMVKKAMDNLDAPQYNLAMRFLGKFSSLKRAGITLSPEFMGMNVVRDQLSAFLFSEGSYMPVLSAFHGAGILFKKNDIFLRWLRSGGANSTIVSADKKLLESDLFALHKDTNLYNATRHHISHPVEMARKMSEFVELTTRLGEAKLHFKKGDDINTTLEGGLASRNVSIDFARAGVWGRQFNHIMAFWNPMVQGIDKVFNEQLRDPAKRDRFLKRSMMAITVPSVMLWMANKDTDWYKSKTPWERNNFWWFGPNMALPKPHEMGLIFGSIPERILDAFHKDHPEAFKGLSKAMYEAFIPDVVLDAVRPIFEQFSNRNTFTDNPLVPLQMIGVLSQDQYFEYTSESAKVLSKVLGGLPLMRDQKLGALATTSPLVIENYVRSWAGTLGMYALKVAEDLLIKTGVVPDPVKPASTLSDIPFIKAFWRRYPHGRTRFIEDFYDTYFKNKQIIDTIALREKRGDYEGAHELRTENYKSGGLISMQSVKKSMDNLNAMLQFINQNKQMNPDEKRQKIDEIYVLMNEVAKQGINEFRTLKDKLMVH